MSSANWLSLKNIIGSARAVMDGWSSSTLNPGKEESFTPLVGELSEDQLERLFRTDARARAIVMAAPWHALRFGFGLNIEGDEGGEQAAALVKRMGELSALDLVFRAAVEGRLHGGALLIVGADTGESGAGESERMRPELKPESVRRIAWLKTAQRNRVVVTARNADPTAQDFGKPEVYTWSPDWYGSPMAVHESRTLRFPGAFTTNHTKRTAVYSSGDWDDSVLLVAYPDLRALGSAMKALPTMLLTSSTVVHKTPKLMSMLAGDNASALRTKYATEHELRTVYGVSVIDKEDEIEIANLTLTGVTDIIDRLMMGVSSAPEAPPVTLLFGRSPAGMNATGESDLSAFDADVEAYRTQTLEPLITELVRLFMLEDDSATNGTEPERWEITWPTLRPPTATEKAEREKMHADRIKALVAEGIILPEEAALILGDPDNKERAIKIDLDLRQKLLEIESDRAVEQAENPPPPPPMVPGDPEEMAEDEPEAGDEEE